MTPPLLIALTVLVGALIPLQSGINATSAKALGHPLFAALTNFAVGGLALFVGALAFRLPLPSKSAVLQAPLWSWWGGLCGAALVTTAILAAPRLGAALLVATLIAGQLGSSVLLDHMGWVGFATRPVSALRLVGVALLAAGVFCVRRG